MRPSTGVYLAAFLLGFGGIARADEDPRFFAALNASFNAYTYVGPVTGESPKPATYYTPTGGGAGLTNGRAVMFEQAGFGYQFQEHFRATLLLMFGEFLTNPPTTPAGASSFALAAAIPCLQFLFHGYWLAAGPAFSARSSGVAQFGSGLLAATGWAFPLGRGFTLSPAVQMLALLYQSTSQRTTVGISPAIAMGYRF